jgi:hypothetical protein
MMSLPITVIRGMTHPSCPWLLAINGKRREPIKISLLSSLVSVISLEISNLSTNLRPAAPL